MSDWSPIVGSVVFLEFGGIALGNHLVKLGDSSLGLGLASLGRVFLFSGAVPESVKSILEGVLKFIAREKTLDLSFELATLFPLDIGRVERSPLRNATNIMDFLFYGLFGDYVWKKNCLEFYSAAFWISEVYIEDLST